MTGFSIIRTSIQVQLFYAAILFQIRFMIPTEIYRQMSLVTVPAHVGVVQSQFGTAFLYYSIYGIFPVITIEFET